MSDIRHWFHLIDFDVEPETVGPIVSSAYDMVILDRILSELSSIY